MIRRHHSGDFSIERTLSTKVPVIQEFAQQASSGACVASPSAACEEAPKKSRLHGLRQDNQALRRAAAVGGCTSTWTTCGTTSAERMYFHPLRNPKALRLYLVWRGSPTSEEERRSTIFIQLSLGRSPL